MHDLTELESRGIPGVMVASREFIGAAEAQARALGFRPACVFLPHPIQDRTDEEMWQIADDAVDAVIAALTVEGG